MEIRTDLAAELREIAPQPDDGIYEQLQQCGELIISTLRVMNERGERQLGRPRGRYITISTPPLEQAGEQAREAVSEQLTRLLPRGGTVLVCGIGNADITPDALGPKTALGVLATRHINGALADTLGLGRLRSVAVLSPGVLGQTGVETGELLEGAISRIHPSAVIAVDALAARSIERLGCTVQLADSGIVPGGGVGNARRELSAKTLGVPVISLGVPTVVDAQTLANDLCESETLHRDKAAMIVTPRGIDMLIKRAAALLAHAINCALQPQLEPNELLELMK